MVAPVLSHFEKPITLSFNGIAIDEFGDPLPRISVAIRQGGVTIDSTSSSELGQFEFNNVRLNLGIHSVVGQSPGYKSADEEVVVKPEMEGTVVNVTLRLESTLGNLPLNQLVDAKSGGEHPGLIRRDRFLRMRVFFATDRKEGFVHERDFRKAFLDGRNDDGELRYGQCELSIPEGHRIGNLETPRWFKLEFRQNPNKHVVLLDLQKLDENSFFSTVSSAVQSSGRHEAFVFVHGYSVTFAEAVRRTAQIAFDLGFEGAPICYSWPSKGSYTGYPADEASIDWTEPHLLEFLKSLSSQKDIRVIHLLAHSMGNRALVRCLERIGSAKVTKEVIFDQTILAAPDIDAGVFESLARHFGSVAKRVTLYASSGDRPLHLSRDFHSYPRAGDTGSGIVVLPGVDTIDASNVPTDLLGHSYYGDTRTVLSDVYELFKNGSPPPRFGLRPQQTNGKKYWVFVP